MTGKRESLKTVVGGDVYAMWAEMLHSLVPEGRTHRLAPMVAGMLQYAAAVAYEKYGDDPEEDSIAYSLLVASETYDPQGAVELLHVVEQLFKDAQVEYERVNYRGDEYSIADSIIYEFVHWHDMPWEA
jgi:hypothetical protein